LKTNDPVRFIPGKSCKSRIFGFSVIRNEVDIAQLFIGQAIHLFDKFVFVDLTSTDGTQELLSQAARENESIVVYKCSTRRKYQVEIMNFLAREALREGADWMFFLDADEFIPIEGRVELEEYLGALESEILFMPWINLVPSVYSDFHSFDVGQKLYWSGRTSPICKVAVSSLYFHDHPDAFIGEGNRSICPYSGAASALPRLGMPLLHVPVRSRQRLKYKITNNLRLLEGAHDIEARTGGRHDSHVSSFLDAMDIDVAPAEYLNAIAANYGQPARELEGLEPEKLDWPAKFLPRYGMKLSGVPPQALSVGATLAADAKIDWRDLKCIHGSLVTAAVEGNELLIVSQPMSGRLRSRYGRFETLPPINKDVVPQLDWSSAPKLLAATLTSSLLPIKATTFSPGSQLIPTLSALFPLVHPRRYVELGVHSGANFFAACQVSSDMGTNTECIAIDSWVDDFQASSQGASVFDGFKETLTKDYPNGYFIKGTSTHAVQCFSNNSIDLLHIGGYHTYESAKEDFGRWLSKMSRTGVVLFRGTNVYKRNLGVWQLWQELCERYLGLSFIHSYGLGVLYVGDQDTPIAAAFRWLSENPAYLCVAQKYLTILGENLVDSKIKEDELYKAQQINNEQDHIIHELSVHISRQDESIRQITEKKDHEIDALSKHIFQLKELIPVNPAPAPPTVARAMLEDGRLSIPVNPQLGNAREYAIVITKALRRLVYGIKVRRFMLLPFRTARRRYRKQMKLAKQLSRTFTHS
jgi:hypothetical protein